MRKTLLAFVLISVLGVPCHAAEKAAPNLRDGAANVDITPKEFPLSVPGLFTPRKAESAHDPLHARALVLDDGTTTLAMVAVDSIGVPQEALDEAKGIASQQCGIAMEKMLVASTHTHTGPPSNVKSGPAPEVAYRKLLVAGIAEAIVRAHAALRAAGVGVAVEPIPDEVYNRRWFLKPGKMPPNPFGEMDQVKMNPTRSPAVLDRPAGPTDPDLTIISVQDAGSRKPLAIVANFTLHYVGGVPDGQLSADYFGEFARVMQSNPGVGKGFVAMMFNGAQGDVINRPFLTPLPKREPFEQIELVAGKAAAAAWRARAKIKEYRQDACLGMIQREVTLKVRRPTAEQIAWANRTLAVKDEAEIAKLPRLAPAYARRTLSMAKYPETVTVQLQVIRIGDLAVCCIPFETFCEIGLDLKKRSPFARTMVISLANGTNGYLPTPEQHKLGGYETWLGTNRVQKDASVIVTDNLLEMLAELKKNAAEGTSSK